MKFEEGWNIDDRLVNADFAKNTAESFKIVSRTETLLRISKTTTPESRIVLKVAEAKIRFITEKSYNAFYATTTKQTEYDEQRWERLTATMSDDDKLFISTYCQPRG